MMRKLAHWLREPYGGSNFRSLVTVMAFTELGIIVGGLACWAGR